jgi:hypothetical protein
MVERAVVYQIYQSFKELPTGDGVGDLKVLLNWITSKV